ncbi:MAG: serine/threonine protein kinase [Lentisphaeraceae bacterium]|nr:serine/threonine protein kinase [Lentisphaeraceae bacterium]
MSDSTPEEREEFFNSINPHLLQVFDENIDDFNEELRFPLQHEALAFEEGQHRVHVSSEIGRGGMKIIYKCISDEDKKIIALATLKDRKKTLAVERFLKEAKIISSLAHYNIIRLYDYGISDKYGPYMAMNYVDGPNLAKVIKRLSQEDSRYDKYKIKNVRINIFKQVMHAVSYAHEHGIVHLDLKPENVLLHSDDRVYLCDWGLAKVLPQHQSSDELLCSLASLSETGIIKGSPGYMAPEQISGDENSILSDIYQLGAMLFALIYLRPPVDGDTHTEVFKKTLNGELDLPQQDCEILKVIHKALSKRPGDRFNSVSEMLQASDSHQVSEATRQSSTSPLIIKLLYGIIALLITMISLRLIL